MNWLKRIKNILKNKNKTDLKLKVKIKILWQTEL